MKLKKDTPAITKTTYRDPGLKGVTTTTLFRTFNFELFAKPNKYVMGFGLIAITGCVSYLAYLNATAENRKEASLYNIVDEEGNVVDTHRKISKWE